ncbi:hypothetical protein [Brucella pseudogrignonensis]|uniref:Uncharacterized protein n=1 Tax=Brucella pseudogrignonensis TaxID=419475 RepID=A0ABU1MF56_9HYPH|nr:hypothetical protein [Brucella pseudogrignonensis]MDR6434636.1 hypothetical protein [Brucella pseudogrignonensis]
MFDMSKNPLRETLETTKVALTIAATAIAITLLMQPAIAESNEVAPKRTACVLDKNELSADEAVIVTKSGCFVVDAHKDGFTLIKILSEHIRRLPEVEVTQ